MSKIKSVSVCYVPATEVMVHQSKWRNYFKPSPAHWAVHVDMHVSLSEYVFTTKPSRKQVSQCIRKAIKELKSIWGHDDAIDAYAYVIDSTERHGAGISTPLLCVPRKPH